MSPLFHINTLSWFSFSACVRPWRGITGFRPSATGKERSGNVWMCRLGQMCKQFRDTQKPKNPLLSPRTTGCKAAVKTNNHLWTVFCVCSHLPERSEKNESKESQKHCNPIYFNPVALPFISNNNNLKKKSLLLCCQVDAKLSLERKQFDAYLHQSGFLKQISDL